MRAVAPALRPPINALWTDLVDIADQMTGPGCPVTQSNAVARSVAQGQAAGKRAGQPYHGAGDPGGRERHHRAHFHHRQQPHHHAIADRGSIRRFAGEAKSGYFVGRHRYASCELGHKT